MSFLCQRIPVTQTLMKSKAGSLNPRPRGIRSKPSTLNPKHASQTRTLRVQVPNNHILTQNLYYSYYYPNPKYLIIEYMDPLGKSGTPRKRLCETWPTCVLHAMRVVARPCLRSLGLAGFRDLGFTVSGFWVAVVFIPKPPKYVKY